MNIIRHIFLTGFTLLLVATSGAQTGNPANPTADDPILSAMQTEMKRSQAQLKLEGVAAPYYLDYRVMDMDVNAAEAAFGALRTNVRARFRFLRVIVRIGDYKQDSFAEGQGVLDYMPLDDDLLSLRHQLWQATDRAYKEAAEGLTAKQAQLKQFTIEQPVDDFARAEPVQSIRPLAKLDVDATPWLKLIEDSSGLYRSDPLIQSFGSSFQFQATNRYFVSSEGTVVRDGYSLFQINSAGSTQAADGMRLDRSDGDVVGNIKELPSPEKFLARTNMLLTTLHNLREAPIADEDYHGPVLFSADAAATVFSSLVGSNLLGTKPALGQPARTKGAWATGYKTRVLPDFISVIDDPTITALDGKPLLGHYAVDDEGVNAMSVPLIENGKLVNYLIGRSPIRDFPTSNGHGRARVPANAPGPSFGNMIVRSSAPVPHDQLKKKLIELCQQRELPFGYFVETFGPLLTPRLLYKVWTKDGREELVRGASFGDLDTRALRNDLVAAGDDVYIDNEEQAIPHSVVTPSILFDELEVKRTNANKDKLPEYPAPAIK